MSVERRGDRVRYTSIAVRLGIFLIVLVAAAVMVASVSLIVISRDALEERVKAQQQATSREVARAISAYVNRSVDDLKLVGRVQAMLALDEEDVSIVLDSLRFTREPRLRMVAWVDETGQERVKISTYPTYLPGELVNQSQADFFTRAMGGQTYIGPIYISEESGLPTVEIAVPFQASRGQADGVLVAEVDLALLWTDLAAIEIGDTGYTYIVDAQGDFVAHRDSEVGSQLYGRDMSHLPPVADFVAGAKSEETFEYEGLNQERVLGNLIPIVGTNWAAVVEIPTREAYASLDRMLRASMGLLLLALVVTAVFGYLIQRQFVQPIRDLTVGAEQIASGNLDAELSVPGQAGEITVLGRAFQRMQTELKTLYTNLEQQVAERTQDLERTAASLSARTSELEEITQRLEEVARQGRRRALMLQASSEIGRAIAQIHDMDRLLPRVTQLISEHFGFYHAGIFLVDEVGRYAVLRAANSEGGQRMLARGHKLAVGAKGIVGHVTRTGQPRISLDVGADAVYFDNPDLPDTRSEMALPLQMGGEIIGALDVQSTEAAGFDQEDVAVLSTLADQIAIAIQNARLFHQSQESLQEAEMVYKRHLREEWDSFLGGLATRKRQPAGQPSSGPSDRS